MSNSRGRKFSEQQVWALAESNVAEWSRLDPCQAIVSGVAVSGAALTNYDDEACQDRAALARRTRDEAAALVAALPPGPAAVAAAVISERCGIEAELYESGQMQRRLDVVTCPLQEVRRAIDLTVPADHGSSDGEDVLALDDAWSTFRERLAQVPAAVRSYLAGLDAAADRGDAPALRQIEAVATQCEQLADGGHFAGLVNGPVTQRAVPTPRIDQPRLREAALEADAAYAHAAWWLRQELGSRASTDDAFGAERYSLWARWYVGADVDLREAHAWAAEEFICLESRAATAAAELVADVPVREVLSGLYQVPDLQVCGRDRARDWLRSCSEDALHVAGALFDIPAELRPLEWKLSEGGGGVHYLAPAEDGSRPGTVWWTLADDEPLATWLARPTVVHEGVPGHHLQIGQAVLSSEHLTRFQRHRCEIAGYVEGWGLYAEQLMESLGFFEAPADKLGFLQNQFLRTARVLVDIGVHLHLEIPDALGPTTQGRWTPQNARAFLADRAGLSGSFLDFELERYLGRAAQAIAYKLGEKRWLSILNSAVPNGGTSLREAHTAALRLGPASFNQLQTAIVPADQTPPSR